MANIKAGPKKTKEPKEPTDPGIPEKITLEGEDSWLCLCGNTPDGDGFFPCDDEGNQVEPTPEAWKGVLYVCARCGRIIAQFTLKVVGKVTTPDCEGCALLRSSGEGDYCDTHQPVVVNEKALVAIAGAIWFAFSDYPAKQMITRRVATALNLTPKEKKEFKALCARINRRYEHGEVK